MWTKDEGEGVSEGEQDEKREAKKKRFPFHSKAEGGRARRRPDRLASGGLVKRRRGGSVSDAADGDLIKSPVSIAPKGGAVKQKFQEGGPVEAAQRRKRENIERTAMPTIPTTAAQTAAGLSRERVGRPPSLTGPTEGLKRGGHLSAGQRRALPSSDFALPGKGEGPEGKGSGSYPIPDEGHAKSALSRGKHNASPGELATIKRKVKAKFPGMDVS